MRTAFLILGTFVAFQFAIAADAEITKDRAHQLATRYFARYIDDSCGGADEPTLRGQYWKSTVRIGYAHVPSGAIRVHRQTGMVSYDLPFSFRPTVSPESLDRWTKSLHARTKKP